jgi:hypothetical protein
MEATQAYHAVPTYMGPGWSLHMSHPRDPGLFRAVPKDFLTREEAEQYARDYAMARGATVQFRASVLDVTDPA